MERPADFSESALLGITGTRAFILRRGDVETVAQGEGNAARVVVLGLRQLHTIEVERTSADALVEEVVTRQFDVEPPFEQVLTDTE